MIRFILIFLIFLVALWQWRQWRGTRNAPTVKPPQPTADMVACAHCGTHVPIAEAISGRKGRYCCPEHRRIAEPG